jgi:hypothetical protein
MNFILLVRYLVFYLSFYWLRSKYCYLFDFLIAYSWFGSLFFHVYKAKAEYAIHDYAVVYMKLSIK